MELRTDAVFEALRAPLALVEDDGRRQAIERYLEAARLPLERAVFDLMAGLAAAVDAKAAPRLRVRLAYRPGALELELEEQAAAEPYTLADVEFARPDGEMEKVTIRIPAELKDLAAQAAGGAGISLNSWYVRALAGAARAALRRSESFGWGEPPPPPEPERDRPGRSSRRMSGWIGTE